jgi:hypothetical protein
MALQLPANSILMLLFTSSRRHWNEWSGLAVLDRPTTAGLKEACWDGTYSPEAWQGRIPCVFSNVGGFVELVMLFIPPRQDPGDSEIPEANITAAFSIHSS